MNECDYMGRRLPQEGENLLRRQLTSSILGNGKSIFFNIDGLLEPDRSEGIRGNVKSKADGIESWDKENN